MKWCRCDTNPTANRKNISLFNVPIDGNIDALLDRLESEVRRSDLSDDIMVFLRDSVRASDSLSTWAGRILAQLFRDTPLLLFAPHLDAARRLAAPIMAQEIDEPLATTRLANAGGDALSALGHEPQVIKSDDEINFFSSATGCVAKSPMMERPSISRTCNAP